MPFKNSRENKLAVWSHVLIFVAFFSAMLGKLDPSTFKGFDGDVIGGLLTFLASALIFGSFAIGLGGWLGSLVSGSKISCQLPTASNYYVYLNVLFV